MIAVFQLDSADNEFNVLLPLVGIVFISVIGLIFVVACCTIYKIVGKTNAGRIAVILSQAVISLIGTAVIGIIALGVAFGLKTILGSLR